MGIGETEQDPRRIGLVKGAISLYGQRVLGDRPGTRKKQMEFSEHASRPRELYLAKRDINQFNSSRKFADSVRAQAEVELLGAKMRVKDLTAEIEKSNWKSEGRRKHELEMLRKQDVGGEGTLLLDVEKSDIYGYDEARRELEALKQDLSKLKLDMARVKETKLQAEMEIEASVMKTRVCSSSIEALNKKIEEANEEQILVELARIEAQRELGAIKAQREVEFSQFSSNVEKIRNRIKAILQATDRANQLETTLAVTASEVNVLQNELNLVKAIEVKTAEQAAKKRSEEEHETFSLSLKSVMDELEMKKKELESIREEGYQCMFSMDIIREEIKSVSTNTTRSRKRVNKADSTVEHLNTKLVKANSKLEALSSAEGKAKLIVSNLSSTLEHLKSEADDAKKDKEQIDAELFTLKREVDKINMEIDVGEERLETVLIELEAVVASEARALNNLRVVAENTMRTRVSRFKHGPHIIISRSEYDYLRGHAKEAEKIAEKKVLAAKAWLEALKAGEREIILETEIANAELRLWEEQQPLYTTEKPQIIPEVIESEVHSGKPEKVLRMTEDSNLQLEVEVELPRNSMRNSGSFTPSRRTKSNLRRPSSPGGRHLIQSGSITLRRRKRVMPNLAKLFGSNKT